ncbi:RidA family protein [Sporolactobacillus laevolacticus]|uniref:RidA family protein n=1 Tax=Sporolactobacillus laevolacticus TaxID=33018 RepID=UPI0025B38B32|nr:RidA family protein [Sporolactobacillus laevolacticus]MDN3954457.1 RidA family protein [Sporolactobacillus laevolacticus]
MEIKKSNPINVAPPVAQYSHVTVIPKDAELVVLSGQIGNDKNGQLPTDIETQFGNALENIKSILESEGVDLKNIFKVNFWFTEKMDRERYLEEWSKFANQTPPATTLAYVSALARPEIKVEVETWAAK